MKVSSGHRKPRKTLKTQVPGHGVRLRTKKTRNACPESVQAVREAKKTNENACGCAGSSMYKDPKPLRAYVLHVSTAKTT